MIIFVGRAHTHTKELCSLETVSWYQYSFLQTHALSHTSHDDFGYWIFGWSERSGRHIRFSLYVPQNWMFIFGYGSPKYRTIQLLAFTRQMTSQKTNNRCSESRMHFVAPVYARGSIGIVSCVDDQGLKQAHKLELLRTPIGRLTNVNGKLVDLIGWNSSYPIIVCCSRGTALARASPDEKNYTKTVWHC